MTFLIAKETSGNYVGRNVTAAVAACSQMLCGALVALSLSGSQAIVLCKFAQIRCEGARAIKAKASLAFIGGLTGRDQRFSHIGIPIALVNETPLKGGGAIT